MPVQRPYSECASYGGNDRADWAKIGVQANCHLLGQRILKRAKDGEAPDGDDGLDRR